MEDVTSFTVGRKPCVWFDNSDFFGGRVETIWLKVLPKKRVFASIFLSEFPITRSIYPRHSTERFWKTTFLPIDFHLFQYSTLSSYCFKDISCRFPLFIAKSCRTSSDLIFFTSFLISSFHLFRECPKGAFFPLIHYFGSNVPSFLLAWPVHWKRLPLYLVHLFKFVVLLDSPFFIFENVYTYFLIFSFQKYKVYFV